MSDDSDTDVAAISTDDGPSLGERLAASAPGDVQPRARKFAPTTREAFKAAFAPGGKHHVPEGELDHDDLVPAVGAAEDKPAEPEVKPAAVAPQAPAPEAQAIVAHHEAIARQLAERDEALKKREQSHRDVIQRFRDDPSETIRDLIREAHGLERDEDVRAAAFDLVGDLSGQVLGLEVPEAVKAKSERQKAERLIKAHNKRLADDADKVKREREQLDKERADAAAQNVLRGKLDADKAKYPYLMVEDEPHVLVWKVAETLIKEDPNWSPSWEDAAKRAEQYLKSQASAYYGKRKHLLSPEPPKPTVQTQTTQERAPGSRSTVTLTNGQAQETSPTSNGARPLTNEDRRRASLSKLRASLPGD